MRAFVDGVELTGRSDFYLTRAEGLSPDAASVHTEDFAFRDGAAFMGATVGARRIVLVLKPVRDPEEAREAVYGLFPLKESVTLRFRTASKDVTATGYVERVECDLFARVQAVEVSVLCMDPYFYDVSETSMVAGKVQNDGLPVGVVATSSGSVSDGTRIFSLTGWTGTYYLDTREGRKSVKDGNGNSLVQYISSGAGWPTAGKGETTFTGATTLKIRQRWLGC